MHDFRMAPGTVSSCKRTTCYAFRKLDHALLLVGWGTDSSKIGCYFRGGKNLGNHECDSLNSENVCESFGDGDTCRWGGYPFWTFQNSWGSSYGENGFLRIGPRGGNPFQLEAMATAADLVLTHKVLAKEEMSVTIKAATKKGSKEVFNAEGLLKAHGKDAIVSTTKDS